MDTHFCAERKLCEPQPAMADHGEGIYPAVSPLDV